MMAFCLLHIMSYNAEVIICNKQMKIIFYEAIFIPEGAEWFVD